MFSFFVMMLLGSLYAQTSAVAAGPFFEIPSENSKISKASSREAGFKSPNGGAGEWSDVYAMEFVWRSADGSSETLTRAQGVGRWSGVSSAIEVYASTLDDGLSLFDVYVDGEAGATGSLKVKTTLSLPKPVVYSRYAEYDFIQEKTKLGSLTDSVKWLVDGETKVSYTPVLGLENTDCGIELILPANNHEDKFKKKGIEITQREASQSITWHASLTRLVSMKDGRKRFQFGLHDYCDDSKKQDPPSLVIYPAAAFQQAASWLKKLTPTVESMAFFTWKNFPVTQVGSPVVEKSSEKIDEFTDFVSQLQDSTTQPLLYSALHGMSSHDPMLAKFKEEWISEKSRRSGWTQFKNTKLQPVSLESAELRSHLLENITTAWKQGYTQSVYLDLAMPTRTKLTSRRAFGASSASEELAYTPLLHQWAFLRDLALKKSEMGMSGRIVMHSGMIVPRFLSRYVDNVLVGEPLWREFSDKASGEYIPMYQSLPEPLVRFFWGKRNLGEPILLPLLTTRYNDKLRRRNKISTPKARGNRAQLKSETRDLVRFLLASDLQLWASGTDMKVVRDYFEGIEWLGGTANSEFCIVPLKGKRQGEALGVRKRGQRAIAYHLYNEDHWNGQRICHIVDEKITSAIARISAREKPQHVLVRIE